MGLFGFLIQVILISISGVMAPGPITAVAIGKGYTSPHSGAFIAIGHGIVEFPLIIAISYGFGYLLKSIYLKALIAFLGSGLLILMGIGQFKRIGKVDIPSGSFSKSPMLAGVILSAGNPYFLLWWATIGATLIFNSFKFGIFGLVTFMITHWLCDFIWLYFLSVISFKGGRFFGMGFQKIIFGICGIFLFFFGLKFLVDGIKIIY